MPPACRQILKCYLVFSHLCRILRLLATDGSSGGAWWCAGQSRQVSVHWLLLPDWLDLSSQRRHHQPSPACRHCAFFPGDVTRKDSLALERLERLERLQERIKKISNLPNNGHHSWRQLLEMTCLARYINPGVSHGKHAPVRSALVWPGWGWRRVYLDGIYSLNSLK